jgi:hypothetical protein
MQTLNVIPSIQRRKLKGRHDEKDVGRSEENAMGNGNQTHGS